MAEKDRLGIEKDIQDRTSGGTGGGEGTLMDIAPETAETGGTGVNTDAGTEKTDSNQAIGGSNEGTMKTDLPFIVESEDSEKRESD